MPKKIAVNVEEFIADSVSGAQIILTELRKIIVDTIPNVEEKIAWGVPIYRLPNNSNVLCGLSVATEHVSFGIDLIDEEAQKLLKELGYKTGKKTIQIQFNQAVPKEIITQLIQQQFLL